MENAVLFYTLSHIFIAGIGGVLLLAIWYNIRKRFHKLLTDNEEEKRVDKGLLFLSFALCIWAISGFWVYFFNTNPDESSITYTVGVNLFSLLNNLFLLFALSYFDYAPKFLVQNKRTIIRLSIIVALVSLLSIVLSTQTFSNKTINWNGLPDVMMSAFLSVMLLISLYRTFIKQGLVIIAILSVIIILLLFVSQLPEVFYAINDGFINNIIKLVSKISLIMLFMVLATSWVINLANMPQADEVSVTFLDWSLIRMSIPSKGINNEIIDFQSKTTQYKNLLKFAIRRKFGESTNQCIQVGYGQELNNQTYVSRIIDNINSILEIDSMQKLDRRDLFTFIGEGKYRLRINADKISFDEALLHEFYSAAENIDYAKLFLKNN